MNMNYIFPMKLGEFKISISVENYDEKTAEKYQNSYVAKKLNIFKQSMISILNFDSSNGRLQ